MMNTFEAKKENIIQEEYLSYKEPAAELLAILSMSLSDWNKMDLYRRVHISEFYEIVNSLETPPATILEWGGGLSTYVLSHFCEEWNTRRFVTLDHNAEYQEAVFENLTPHHSIEIHTVDLVGGIWPWDEAESNYATFPLSFNEKFDLIFVDGRRRNECMLAASRLVDNSGTVIVHDVWRDRYQLGMGLFRKKRKLDEYMILEPMQGKENQEDALVA